MKCINCGNGLPDDSLFCQYCGVKLTNIAPEYEQGSSEPEVINENHSITEEYGDAIENSIETESEVKCDSQTISIDSSDIVSGNTENSDEVRSTDSKKTNIESINTDTKYKNKKSVLIAAAIIAVVVAVGLTILSKPNIPQLAKSVLFLEIYDHDDEIIGSASGFLISDDTLVTNYHVIDGANNIIAYTPDYEKTAEFNTVLAYDEDRDLAILSGDDNSLDVKYFPLADSSTVEQGDKVYAIGYPLSLGNSLSEGIVSAIYPDDSVTFIQMTAPISEGNSGGPVLNKKGEVIGVTSMFMDDGQNMNYAISSNDVTTLKRNASEKVLLSELFVVCEHQYDESVILEATCTEKGQIEHVCSLCGDSFVSDSDPIGHEYSQEIIQKATCTTDGKTRFTCSNCGDSYSSVVKSTGHSVVVDPEVKATCTNSGKTEGRHCSACGEVITKQEPVPALGHTYVNGRCSVCGASVDTFTILVNEIKAKGYSYSSMYVLSTVLESGETVRLSYNDSTGYVSFAYSDFTSYENGATLSIGMATVFKAINTSYYYSISSVYKLNGVSIEDTGSGSVKASSFTKNTSLKFSSYSGSSSQETIEKLASPCYGLMIFGISDILRNNNFSVSIDDLGFSSLY